MVGAAARAHPLRPQECMGAGGEGQGEEEDLCPLCHYAAPAAVVAVAVVEVPQGGGGGGLRLQPHHGKDRRQEYHH
jgi:hypothetical protein